MTFARKFGWVTTLLLLTVWVGGNVKRNIEAKNEPPQGDAIYRPGSGWEAVPPPKPYAWAPTFDEVGAVTDCDLAAKAQLMAPDSVDWDWSWRILEHPERNRLTVLRGFSSQNVYGAQLAAHYRCLIDVAGPARIIEVNVATGQM